MTKSDFIKKVSNDLKIEHSKRLKMWEEGHPDEEIAFACKTTMRTISKWRKTHNLSERVYLSVARRKDASWLTRGMSNRFASIRGCISIGN